MSICAALGMRCQMTEQLSFLEPVVSRETPRPVLVEPIPVPHPGWQCENCGEFPAYEPQLVKPHEAYVETWRIVCYHHVEYVPTEEVTFMRLQRLVWRWDRDGSGDWVEVEGFREIWDEEYGRVIRETRSPRPVRRRRRPS